jgi:hypothetical protein
MALVSKNIPNFINGVSQQPPALRLESQGEVQENGFSDVVDGLKKRPPTKFINKLVDSLGQPLSNLNTAFFHTYKKSDTEQYQVVITSTPVADYVYPLSGVQSMSTFQSFYNTQGTSAFPKVFSLTDPSEGIISSYAQEFKINITSLPSGGATYEVGRTNVNSNWFWSNPVGQTGVLTLGMNTITVPSTTFNRFVRVRFSSADIEFTALEHNGTNLYTSTPDTSGSHVRKIYVYDVEGRLRYESGAGNYTAGGLLVGNAVNNDDTSYLPDNPKDITATSVADATFIVNKEKIVEMDDYKYPSNDLYQALVYLKSVNYGRTYTVSAKSKTDPTEKLEASYTTNKAVASTASSGGNDDQLKVSAVMSETYSGNSACLREQLENDVGTVLLDSFSYSTLPINTSRAIVDAQLLELPLTNVQSTPFAVSAGDITVQVGGVDIPYDANNVTGWCRISDTKIMLHYDILEDSFGTSDYERQPVYVTSTHGAANAGGFITPDVADSDKEPYFIINTTKSGDIKDFDIKVTDDDGGVNLKAFKGTAKSFTSLPNQCEAGFTLGVVGDNQKKEDDFHVKFEGSAGSGYWRETVANNLYNYFKLSTMPHTLRQLDDGTFKFGAAEDNDGNNWSQRKAGDTNTNPNPSFVGQKIKDIFFHRNRLGVLAGENVVFSEAGGYLNFWRTTVRTLLDSDPIDVSVSQNEVADLKAAIPIQDNLLLFSDLNQFTLSATQLLTPAEVTIDQSTKYECDLTATPVGAGTSVFFATKSGGYAGMREFFTKTDTDIKDAPEITTHIPTYIQGGIRDIQASSNEDMLLALTDTNKNECYVYKWYNSDTERLQSSWSKWIFYSGTDALGNLTPKNIASTYFNNSDLYFTFEDGSFEKMELSSVTSPILLDSLRSAYNQNWESGDPYQLVMTDADTISALRNLDNNPAYTNRTKAITEEGQELGLLSDDAVITSITNYLNTGGTIWFGNPYTFKYQLSEQVFKPVQGDSTKLARFQLRKVSFNFSNTGKFDVTVDSVGRDPVVTNFTGRILGEPENVLGQASIVPEGSFSVGVLSKPDTTKITITNDTHLPSVFQSAEWEGFVVLRNQRL